ncbi:MAG: hypothetical protein RMJ48_08340 [Roseiflexaceae bacterium]|nr:hypothetical protein [Roseiflexaceae bacterium]
MSKALIAAMKTQGEFIISAMGCSPESGGIGSPQQLQPWPLASKLSTCRKAQELAVSP